MRLVKGHPLMSSSSSVLVNEDEELGIAPFYTKQGSSTRCLCYFANGLIFASLLFDDE